MTPKNLKYLKISTAVLAVFGLGYYIFKQDNSGNGVDPTGNGTTPPGPVTNGFNAYNVATQLYDEMKSAGYASFLNSHEADNIFSILKNVNAAQFDKVVIAFGQLPYNETLGSQVNINPFSDLPRKGLVTWMKTELGPDSISILRNKYPNHF